MSRNLVRPYFPLPPAQYDQVYFSEILRSFSVYLQQQQNPGEGRHTNLVLTGLISDTDQGLEPGALFESNGFVKVAKANRPHPASVSATGATGSVTVTTT